jgi:Zn-dependent protease/CBS domain-containing protein
MKWSLQLGRVAGIRIYVHATFAILLVWLGVRAVTQDTGVAVFFSDLGFVALLFACIVLHELGHALTARRFGIATRDITLLPIGGVARLDRMPERAHQELLVALAGPAVNLVLAIALFVVASAITGGTPAPLTDLWQGPLLERLAWVNVLLLVFNLVPAFPMDGGRALRALLAMRVSHLRATRVAAALGQAIALGFGLLGLFGNPFLILIALFVWVGAAAEVAMVELKTALGNVLVESGMLTRFDTIDRGAPLDDAMQLTLDGSQKDFPVLDGGRMVGVLRQERLFEGLARGGSTIVVDDVMEPSPPVVRPDEPLGPVLERLQDGTARIFPVVETGNLVGIVTADNVFELLRFQSALEAWNRSLKEEKPRWRLATG